MLKNILKLNGVQELGKNQKKETLGGHYTGNLQYTCWDNSGELFDSTIDASNSGAGVHCSPNAEVTASAHSVRA